LDHLLNLSQNHSDQPVRGQGENAELPAQNVGLGTASPSPLAQNATTLTGFLASADAHLVQGDESGVLERARVFAERLLEFETLDSGENCLAHADAVAQIVKLIGGSQSLQAASYLVYASAYLSKPAEMIGKVFGESLTALSVEATNLLNLERQTKAKQKTSNPVSGEHLGLVQTENVRRMLLAFSRDFRVVMLRLASCVQTLRYYAAQKQIAPHEVAQEALTIFAPLANRLGIWQIKWEMEDLAFRFLEPQTYKEIAKLLEQKRTEREQYVETLRTTLESQLRDMGIKAQVYGRPKHIYSIAKKMRGKSLQFDKVLDIRALRVIVQTGDECYAALAHVHSVLTPLENEFDDYISRPKPNGYQSLHTVVADEKGLPVEIQIRTQQMHDHAENGVAAHWAYKEAGSKGYAGVSADSFYDQKIAMLRQLLAWEQDVSAKKEESPTPSSSQTMNEWIYVLTPNAQIVELPSGATGVDFAYTLHTNLGHRCRGARVDGQMVPLNTALKNGQTVEIIAAKEGGPSRDWLNFELGFLVSPRARSKVRAWFNALATQENISKGRDSVEKLLQREGKTSVNLEDLADQLGFKNADALFEVVGKDEFSLRNIEVILHPRTEPLITEDEAFLKHAKFKQTKSAPTQSGILVVGVDSLMTQLARCCRPAPPDEIRGFITRGKGVSIHRTACLNFKELVLKNKDRVIEVQWGNEFASGAGVANVYPVDIEIRAHDRQGLLRDISEVFSKEKMNVIGVKTESIKGVAWMTFTIEISDSTKLQKVLAQMRSVPSVISSRRR
jgi:GTP pyrophosphokinase